MMIIMILYDFSYDFSYDLIMFINIHHIYQRVI